MNQKEYNEGYQAAIEAIKRALQGGGDGNGGGQGPDGNDLDPNMTPPPVGKGMGNGGGKGKNDKKGDGQSQTKGGSRTSAEDENQGIVRPEDCIPPQGSGLDRCPETPGGMIDKKTGDSIAQAEGHDPEGGSETDVETKWKDGALKAAKAMDESKKGKPGHDVGSLKSSIEGMYKTATDWKRALKKIVGNCINTQETRQAFAAKNRLAALGEIRRTAKDKYDCLDYMLVCIDSSGSMSDDQLKMCLSETYKVAHDKKPLKLIVVQCDTKIQWMKEYKNLEELKKDTVHATVHGRGGTDFKPVWDMLNNDPKFKRVHPELVMFFTDGYCPQYKRSNKNMDNLIWCILDNPGWDLQYPDRYTKRIHIKSSDIKR
jgi:hypothetical protein